MYSLEEKTFLLLVIVASLAFFWILWPLSGAILWGVAIAILFAPIYRWLLGWLWQRPNLAAFATVLIFVFMVLLPFAAIGAALVQEAAGLYDMVKSGQLDFGLYFKQVADALPLWAQQLLTRFGVGTLAAVQQKIAYGLQEGTQLLATQILALGQSTAGLIINLGVMMYLLFFLLRDGDKLFDRITRAIPLRADQQSALFTKFATVVRATIKGDIFVAMLQGALGGLIFWFLEIRAPLLWGVTMAVLSLLPAVGAALVWLPVAIYLLAVGAVWQGVVLIVFGTFVIGLVDNFLRPALVGKDTRMPDYVVLMSTLGGLATFGPNGFIVGPAIAATFIAIWEIFSKLRASSDQQRPSPGTGGSDRE